MALWALLSTTSTAAVLCAAYAELVLVVAVVLQVLLDTEGIDAYDQVGLSKGIQAARDAGTGQHETACRNRTTRPATTHTGCHIHRSSNTENMIPSKLGLLTHLCSSGIIVLGQLGMFFQYILHMT